MAAWRRIAGFRVVVSWPQAGYAAPPTPVRSLRTRLAGITGALLIVAGTAALGVAVGAQVHAPQPSKSVAGVIGSARGPSLPRSLPVSVNIPAIGVDTKLLHLGLNSDGTIQVPSLETSSDRAAWYKYSATPAPSPTRSPRTAAFNTKAHGSRRRSGTCLPRRGRRPGRSSLFPANNGS